MKVFRRSSGEARFVKEKAIVVTQVERATDTSGGERSALSAPTSRSTRKPFSLQWNFRYRMVLTNPHSFLLLIFSSHVKNLKVLHYALYCYCYMYIVYVNYF